MLRYLFLIIIIHCFFLCHSQKSEPPVSAAVPDSVNLQYNFPIYQTDGEDAENDLSAQDLSTLLQSSRDLYTQVASFQFSSARFISRGYASENYLVLLNGVSLNNPETGTASWSSWGGLNDVTRYAETRFGNGPNNFAFSPPAGFTNLETKASSFKKSTRMSYANANRGFQHRLMFTQASGIMRGGWAVLFSVSARQGDQLIIPGTYFRGQSYFLGIDKKINQKHLISFTGFVSPFERAASGAATKETYELSDSHYYNAYWGYQNGKVRNSNITKTFRPVLQLSHTYSPSLKKRLSTTILYTFGKAAVSGTNFYHTENPRPDYYKYLPSYYFLQHHTSEGEALEEEWRTDVNTRQINWDKMIAANQSNLYTDPSQANQNLNTSETRARYILENKIENVHHAIINMQYNERKEIFFLSGGWNLSFYKNEKYKEMEDLLGASFWIDVDQFAENLGVDPMIQQNDIEHPNKKIYANDKFGYDYILNIQKGEAWGQLEHSFNKVDWYAGLDLSQSNYWRDGLVANGKFPDNSKGKSAKLNFVNYGFKAGLTYKLNGRNFLNLNTQALTRPPEASNMFISPKVRADVVDDLKNENLFSIDASYLAKYPSLKIRFTVYSTQIKDQTLLRTYWHDEYNNNVNIIMTNVNQVHRGLELGIDKTFFSKHGLQFIFGYAESIYTNQPKLQAWQDNNNAALYYNRRVYLKNYRLGNSPQLISSLAYRYNGKKNWFVGISFNYADQIYIAANPDRRTAEATGKFQENEKEQMEKVSAQERLPAYYFVNANAGKSFRLPKKRNLSLNASVNNLLNNTNIITAGFEQLRWSQQQIEKFPNKYYYMSGITFMIILNFNF